jgi:hypothetical protein
MSFLDKYRWEATQIAIIAGVIMTLTLVTGLFGAPRGEGAYTLAPTALSKSMSSPAVVPTQSVSAPQSAQIASQPGAAGAQPSDTREVTVGPNSISNRYTLLSMERKAVPPKGEELILKLHIESLAMEPLVSPFESGMLEIKGAGLQPIAPSTAFRRPIPSGESRNEEIVFNSPQGLNLNEATLRIHYYNYESEIPLNLPLRKGVE